MAEHISNDDIIMSLLNESFYKSAGATSLSDIAEKLSIKKASLYNHFDSRDEIISSTFNSCREYLNEITFTPPNVDEVAKKYSPETVLKGSVNRYFKMHEKEPLFQIYTFVESQKYFNDVAYSIIKQEKEKLLKQTKHLFEVFNTLDKINLKPEQIEGISLWFVSGINDLLNSYLMEKKQLLISNMNAENETSSSENQIALQKVNIFVEQFVILLH